MDVFVDDENLYLNVTYDVMNHDVMIEHFVLVLLVLDVVNVNLKLVILDILQLFHDRNVVID